METMAKTAKINIRVEPDLKARVIAASESLNRKLSVSDIVETAIEEFLAKLEIEGVVKFAVQSEGESTAKTPIKNNQFFRGKPTETDSKKTEEGTG